MELLLGCTLPATQGMQGRLQPPYFFLWLPVFAALTGE